MNDFLPDLFDPQMGPKDGTLTGTSIISQSEPGSNGNEEVLHMATELEPRHQMRFSVIPRTPTFLRV